MSEPEPRNVPRPVPVPEPEQPPAPRRNRPEPGTDLPPLAARIRVHPWPDPVIDRRGHDPRSVYAEWFWLSIVGPSTVWFLRRLAAAFDHSPDGFDLDVDECAAALGLAGGTGKRSSFLRTVRRACQFHFARPADEANLLVRRNMPPLNRGQVLRLPPSLQAAHDDWVQQELRELQAERAAARAAAAAPSPTQQEAAAG